MPITKCKVCKRKLSGRQDKKFCSTQCRSTWNNKLNSDANNFMRNVNNVIRRNRRALMKLNPNGKAKVSRDVLMEHGFNFNYFTNEYITKSGNVYRFCYEYGYLELKNEMYALVIRKEYVN